METKSTQHSNLVVSVDVGSTKINAVVARKNILGRIEILGYGKANNEGVIRGVVSNIDKTAKAISDAIDMAEKTSKQEIIAAHTGITGQHIKSIAHQSVSYRTNPQDEITQEEIDMMIESMNKISLPLGEQIIQVVAQEFIVDDQSNILDPIGMCGSKLQCNFHIITGQASATANLTRSFEKAGIEIQSICLQAHTASEAVLSSEEKEAGVALVDLGGGTTNVSIYHEGILRFTSSIPLGGSIITKDIKAGCSVTQDQAEKLKTRFGSALAEEVVDNRIITIPGLMGREPKEISEKNLARIIQARVQEIFEFIMWEIHKSNFQNKLIAGMVLTGGGANLKNVELLAEYQTGLPSRIGDPLPIGNGHHEKDILLPEFAASIGMVIEAMKTVKAEEPKPVITSAVFDLQEELAEAIPVEMQTSKTEKRAGWLDNVFNKSYNSVKEFFEASPDSEL